MVSKLFLCECNRCLDPTEFGTYIGAPRCRSCQAGFCILNDDDKLFKCNNCDATLTDKQAEMMIDAFGSKKGENMDQISMKIQFGKSIVGENHYSVLQLMTRWLQLFNNSPAAGRYISLLSSLFIETILSCLVFNLNQLL